MIGILVAYILDCLLVSMRKYFGKRNLSKQTLTDDAFLI
jgi:hypothetical protein